MAGVSEATVSMILNNYDHTHFTEATRRRVLEACQKLGYKKAPTAPFGAIQGKLLIAICPSYANMHYVRLITAMQARAKELGYTLLAFSTSRDMADETKIPQMCSSFPLRAFCFCTDRRMRYCSSS